MVYLSRAEWGARTDIPRLGMPSVPRARRSYNIIHHTVIVDADVSPNVWESLDEVKAVMRRLQTIRPDLGADVPYNFVLFLMGDGTIVVCEGRGYDLWGAHTAGRDSGGNYFNGSGIATSFCGNFEDYPTDIDPWLTAINAWFHHLKTVFANLGATTVCGRLTCGHRDFPGNSTACPGIHLYRRLVDFQFIPEAEEENHMPTAEYTELKGRSTVAGLFLEIEAKLAIGVAIPTATRDQVRWLLGGTTPNTQSPSSLLRTLCSFAAASALSGKTIDEDTRRRLRYAVR